MKKIVCFVAILISSLYNYAQSDPLVEDHLLKVNALLPGVSYELGVGHRTSLNFEGIIGFALRGASDVETEFGVYPGLSAEFRYYNNLDRRLGKGKNISGNTGNYFGFLNQYQFGTPIIGDLEYASNFYYNAAVVYGLQRTYRKGFYFSLSFGPGVFVDEYETVGGLMLDARLGWVVGGRKK